MVFSIGSIAPETFDQANPMLVAMSHANQLAQGVGQDYGQILQNSAAKAALPYAGGLAQAQMQQAQAGVPYTQAQTGLINQQAQFYPQMMQYKLLSALNSGPQAQLLKLYGDPNFQALVKSNPQLASSVAAAITNVAGNQYPSFPTFNGTGPLSTYNQQGGGQPQTGGNPGGNQGAIGNQIANNSQGGAPVSSPNNTANPNSIIQQGGATLPMNANQISRLQGIAAQSQGQSYIPSQNLVSTAFGNANPALINSVQQQAANVAAMHNIPAAQQQQLAKENSAYNMFSQSMPDFQNVIKNYSGVAGQLKLVSDRALAAANQNPGPAYQSYVALQKSGPLIANESLQGLGGHATDQQESGFHALTNPVSWDKDPISAFNSLQALLNSMHENSKAITQTVGQNLSQAQSQPTLSATAPMNGSGRVRVVGPDGRFASVPASQLDQAMQQGFKRAPQ